MKDLFFKSEERIKKEINARLQAYRFYFVIFPKRLNLSPAIIYLINKGLTLKKEKRII